ncbi:glycosyltransferase family 61 protein [Agromyces archimandritae]|uniref:Glycosyltransferase family 61 protein n=1 Tax=Agromyces archimandritae TaxID=2781962 RepID=A0A975FPG9_9MICO|nr:glycosyltransferase family 61 protein [Agromyces archimandritae]QTX05263.1 glycosyltransferase family 61 protein [Agromyces archimandritae]
MGFVGRVARRTAERMRAGAEALAARLREPDRRLDERLAGFAGNGPDGAIVVLAASAGEVERRRREFAGRDVHGFVLRAGAESEMPGFGPLAVADAAGLELALRAVTEIALFVDASGSAPDVQAALWTSAYPFVRAGGRYVVVEDRQPRSRYDGPAWARAVDARVDGAGEADSAVGAELARATASVVATARTIVFEKAEPHYLAVTDEDAERLLPSRTPRLVVETLQTIPAERYEHRGGVVHHASAPAPANFGAGFDAPELRLRLYEGELRWISHMLLVHENTILPPSFRFPRSNLDSPIAPRLHGRHYRIPERFEPVAERLPGIYYDLSGGWPSHFGHFMQQSVSKLWGWDAAKARFPELKALVQIREAKGHVFEEAILNAYGIASDDIVWVDERVGVEAFVSAASMFQMHPPPYVHPRIGETWSRLRDGLVPADADGPERVFISRRPPFDGRTCRNLDEVERVFADHGFTVFVPDEHPIAEQARVFARARIVAGPGGSASFNLAYAEHLETLIVLNHEAYTARNEHLISAFGEWDTHYFWSRPDIPHPKGGWSVDAYQSPWAFDFERNGEELHQLLRTL